MSRAAQQRHSSHGDGRDSSCLDHNSSHAGKVQASAALRVSAMRDEWQEPNRAIDCCSAPD